MQPDLKNFNPREFGFRSGLEVHQQILTAEKLFCHCPAGLYSDHYDAQVLRHMRPTLSELGEYDGTALMEFKTHKDIIYRINKHSVCTYEMDDNPPFPINPQAVDIAIEIALLLNCSIVGELHVIRKQYLDGSIPAGFQRTAIVGWNGWIPYKDRKIGIRQLAVEEDACREVSDEGHLRIYTTDRLSMPLIEVVTEPDMLEPIEVREVGEIIGRLLRATGKVRRGIGSVRQDVNVSVEGGTRIEIKGVPRLPLIPDLVHYEAWRQHRLLLLKDLLAARGITQANIETVRCDLNGKLKHRKVAEARAAGLRVAALVLKNWAGLFSHQIGIERTFADDVAARVRVIACLPHRPALLHTNDTRPGGLSKADRETVRAATGMTSDDCAVLVWGPPRDVDTALTEIEIRCREAAVGIPNETRQRRPTGETTFERILPGADRMYPDTDSPPVALVRDRVEGIRAQLPELPWDREARYREAGIPVHLAEMLAISPYALLLDECLKNGTPPAMLTATVLGELTVRCRRMNRSLELTQDNLAGLIGLYRSSRFTSEGFRMILEHAARTGDLDWEGLASDLEFEPVDDAEVKSAVTQAVQLLMDGTFRDRNARFRATMGTVMERLRGRVLGMDVAGLVKMALRE